MHLAAPHFILNALSLFFHVGLCSCGNLSLRDAWQHCGRWIHAHQITCVDTVDLESIRSASNARAKNQTIDRVKWKSDA